MDQDLDALLAAARTGNQEAREQLLAQYKPFVLRQAISIANRHLQWDVDDELSVAWLGFNESIDAFEPSRKVPFPSFARLVIKSRLYDYWRQEQRQKRDQVLLSSDPAENSISYSIESRAAWEDYLEKELARERAEEISRLSQILAQYDIKFRELVSASPKHRETRLMCQQAALKLAGDPSLLSHLLEKKRLPLKELALSYQLNRKTLERGRKYIIAVSIILHHQDELPHLKTYIWMPE
ncbi:MAG: sigma-70 family RNA polymerase sigma factor [Firmicutes bacterium]|nr:sigma-70 family RNA polymerase sigma factor [Bacillota bacterium]